jgi:hypothetical protein
LIASLTKQFRVSIDISKEMLMVRIQNGIFSDRKLAQKNIVFWLECQAANVDYVMQFKIGEPTFNTSPAPSWSKRNKRPNVSPHPQSRKFSNKKKRRMNSPVTPVSTLPNPRNNSQSQNNWNNDNIDNRNQQQQRNRDVPRENMNYRYNDTSNGFIIGNQQIPNPNNGYFDFNSPFYNNQPPHHSGPRNSQVGNDNHNNFNPGQRRGRGGHRGRGGRGRSRSPRQNRNFNGRSPAKKSDGRNLLRYYNANNDN